MFPTTKKKKDTGLTPLKDSGNLKNEGLANILCSLSFETSAPPSPSKPELEIENQILREKNDKLHKQVYEMSHTLQTKDKQIKKLQDILALYQLEDISRGEPRTPESNLTPTVHSPSQCPSPLQPALNPERFFLSIIEQPPSQAIYQRILKPFPTVSVSGIPESLRSNLYVNVTLVKQSPNSDTFTKCGGEPLEGDNRNAVPLSSSSASSSAALSRDDAIVVFRKLKILTTSSQQGGADFVLKFSLQRLTQTASGQNVFEDLNIPSVYSTAISVYSHTLYLKPKQQNQTGLRQSKVKTKASDDFVGPSLQEKN